MSQEDTMKKVFLVLFFSGVIVWIAGCNQMSSTFDCDECADTDTESDEDSDSDSETDSDEDSDDTYVSDGMYFTGGDIAWQVAPPDGVLTLADAVYYCDSLTLGDHDDWRIPTISELRSIVVGCPSIETAGECAITDEQTSVTEMENCDGCEFLSGPGLEGCYWPSSLTGVCGEYWSWTTATGTDAGSIFYEINFNFASVITGAQSPHVRCVRDL